MFGLDPRALALFRMGIGLMVFFDAITRAPDVYAFYSDGGVLPRTEALRLYSFLLLPSFSLHMASGSVWWQGALLAAQGLGGLALAVGWRCRMVAIALYALVAGVQLRNLYIGAGDDALLRLLVLWSIFAPVGRVWSVDAAARSETPDLSPARDLGSLAIAAQLIVVYLGTGYAKYTVEAWRTGGALALHLQSDFHVRWLGHQLAAFPELCALLTHTTVWLELLWPVVFLAPIFRGPVRTLGVTLMGVFTLAFVLALSVNLFPIIATIGLVALLPAWFFDVVGLTEDRLAPVFTGIANALPTGERPLQGWSQAGAQAVAGVLLAWVLVWNVGVARDKSYEGPTFARGLGQALFLQQGWRMFASPATESGWVTVRGETFGGDVVDLMREGGRSPHGQLATALAPRSETRTLSNIYANGRWRQFIKRIAYEASPEAALQFSRYHCREWNAERDGDDRLKELEIVFMWRPVPDPREQGYHARIMWQHGCYR
ncbi:MAG: HTTM domain-containing protein [Proteobacteria bacterium]|nr:HTTM domain-containing protein [Pseudomonadota bacterium]